MQGLKEYTHRIKSLKNTRKITKTMKMVAATRLRRAQEAQEGALLYSTKLTELMTRFLSSGSDISDPLLTSHTPSKRALVLLFSSDRGLCGSFNNQIAKKVTLWIRENAGRFERVDVSFCGRRGFNALKNRVKVRRNYEGVTNKPNYTDARRISEELKEPFLAGRYDEVYLAYNQYHSPLVQKPIVEQFLPFQPPAPATAQPRRNIPYIYEPEEKRLLSVLLPKMLDFMVFHTLLENSAGEQGARMTAMDSATNNADDMISRLTLLRNRARQAAITKELSEIVSGAEAMK
jgi:F-type H+-transporting ATPase subunit gamma